MPASLQPNPSSPNLNAAIEQLRTRIAGEVVLPGDPAYQAAREMRAFTHEHFPPAVVHATCAADVAESVRIARAHGIPFSVRGGGHSVAGLSVVDGALTIDLTPMRHVDIDPITAIARVEGGARSVDLAIPAHEYGLALSTGDTGTVGLGGLVTGGGIGYFVRKYGLAADRLRSAKVVTADGEIITASPLEHPDLFWAIRGGGGNFGIIVEFEFELVPVRDVYGGALVLPATREVVRGYLEYAATAPDELSTMATIVLAPPAPFIPAERVGERVLLILAAYSGDSADGEMAMAPLRELARPIADTITTIPYPAMFQYMGWAEERHGAAIRMMFTDDIPDATIDEFLDAMGRATSPFSGIHMRGLGGQLSRIAAGDAAFAHRDRQFFVAVLALWMDPADDGAAHRQWAEDIWGKISHLRDGAYVNFLENEGEARVREAYSGDVYERLAAVKAAYDPDNVFRFNQNVRPQEESARRAA